MYCSKCGSETPDGAGFCPKCGQAVVGREAASLDAPEEPVVPSQRSPQAEPNVGGSQPDSRKAPGGVLAGAGVILVVLAIVRLLSAESQLIRMLGGSDSLATAMLVIGVPLALLGVWLDTMQGDSDEP